MVRGIVAGLCLVLAMAALVEAQAVEVPALGGGGWKAVGKGASAGGVLTAIGSGADHTYWQSEPLGLKPATVYHLSFRARKRGSGGSPISGPVCCNRDLGGVSAEWKRFDSCFVTPTTLRPEDCRLRFGQWQVKGEVDFDSVELHQAQAVYAHHGGIELGEGEMILDGRYTFVAPFQSESRNHSRPLESVDCGFNSERWTFGNNSRVVYWHRIMDRMQNAAEVAVSVNWYNSGELTVEASKNGRNWYFLGTMAKVSTQSFKIPQEMLPADNVYVRLTAKPGQTGSASLQVNSYNYSAALIGAPLAVMRAPANMIGRTNFVTVLGVDPRLDITIKDIGDGLPNSPRNQFAVRINNTTDRLMKWQPGTACTSGQRSWPVYSVAAPLSPGPTLTTIPYEIGSDDEFTKVDFTLGKDITFRASVEFRVPELQSHSYGQLLQSEHRDVGLWWALSGWKIGRDRALPTARGEAVAIRVARNEAEAVQLVVRPTKTLRGFSAQASKLSGMDGGTIPAECVEVLREKYLMIARPTDKAGTVGFWPDPLPAIAAPFDLDANENQPLWVRVRVPKDAKPGDYIGSIELKAEGYADEVALRVHVYDFALPDRMTCQSAFGFSPGNVWRYQGLQTAEDRRAVLDKYFASFSAHHISPYDPAPLDPVKVTWADAKTNPRAVFDFSAWDKAMTRSMDQFHFNSFRLNIPGMGGGTFHARVEPELLGFRENAPQYKAAFASYCKQMEEHLREKGWLPYAYVYWFDEPDRKDYEFVSNGFRKLKEAAPGITRMLTEQPEPELFGGPNIWCAITPEYNHAKAEPRRKEGEKFWWYVCTGPKAPYCTLFIDHPATELRVWLWQTWQRKIDGILVWETNYWTSGTAYPDRNRPQNPYEDPMSWTSGYGVASGTKAPWGNGDGRFIYPPESAASGNAGRPILDGPVDSIRWEMLRDGIEDYEYLAILRRLIDEKKLSGEERERYAKLLAVPAEITKDMTTFTKDPRAIEARREEVARAIEMLNRK